MAAFAHRRTDLRENEVGVLGGKLSMVEEDGVAGPEVGAPGVDGHVETRADGVEVDIAHELAEGGVFFDEGVLEAVVEQIPGAAVDPVEGGGVRAEPALNEAGEGEVAGAQPGVSVVGHERPGVEAGAGLADEGPEAIEERVAVAVGAEDRAAFDAAEDALGRDAKPPGVEAGAVLEAGSEEPRCSWAPFDTTGENDWNLAASRYKPRVAEPVPDEDPAELIREVLAIEKEITEGLEKLLKEIEA